MLFGRSKAVVLEVPPVVPIPVLESLEASSFGGVELSEYQNAASAIGFSNGALLSAELRDFFVQEGIRIYNYDKVSAFLTDKAQSEAKNPESEKRVWCWKPLRETDANKLVSGQHWEQGHISAQRYHGAVPYTMLCLVQKIADKFGEQVHFYVSDYAARNPDPFLAVTGVGTGRYVIAHWDEPNFRG